MNTQIDRLKTVLLVAGVIEIAVGLLHFGMPYFAYQSAGFMGLDSAEINFVTLIIYAVGILLIAFGCVTVLFGRQIKSTLNILTSYLVIKIALWAGRVLLELIYPVELSMFYIDPFTYIVLPGLIFELLLFVFAWILVRRVITQ